MTTTHALLALPLLLLLASAAGCAAPLQQGGVEVRPGIEQRLGAMCRYGHGGQDLCVPDDGLAEQGAPEAGSQQAGAPEAGAPAPEPAAPPAPLSPAPP